MRDQGHTENETHHAEMMLIKTIILSVLGSYFAYSCFLFFSMHVVNNVGMAPTWPVKFAKMKEEDVWGQVNVNVGAIVGMTRLVLPHMIAKRKGAIINLSSVASSGPMPLVGLYSATKVRDFLTGA